VTLRMMREISFDPQVRQRTPSGPLRF